MPILRVPYASYNILQLSSLGVHDHKNAEMAKAAKNDPKKSNSSRALFKYIHRKNKTLAVPIICSHIGAEPSGAEMVVFWEALASFAFIILGGNVSQHSRTSGILHAGGLQVTSRSTTRY